MRKVGNTRKSNKTWLVPSIVLVAVAALSAIAFMGAPNGKSATTSTTPTTSSGATTAAPEQQPSLAHRKPGDPLAIGNINAPVVMVEYAEFQCPFCGMFARDTQPILIDKYVRNGTLRIEWRDFPYLGPESTTASLATRAAADQGKFWQFHDALFARQFPPNSGNLTKSYLTSIAESLGLNIKKFHADMESLATKRAVAQDFTEGQNIGVTGTPSFLVNSTPIVGAQPLQIFEQAIEKAAKAAAKTK